MNTCPECHDLRERRFVPGVGVFHICTCDRRVCSCGIVALDPKARVCRVCGVYLGLDEKVVLEDIERSCVVSFSVPNN